MILKSNTVLFIVGRDGMSKMTLAQHPNGESKWDSITPT